MSAMSSPLFQTSLSKYKDLNARFLKWLSSRAEDLKITSLDDLDLDEPTHISSSKKGSQGRGKNGSTPKQKSPLPTSMRIKDLERLTNKIIQTTNSKVPEAVFTVLDQIIEFRVEIGLLYSRQEPLPRALMECNHRHQHFIESLKKIRRMLEVCPTNRPRKASIKAWKFMSLRGLEGDSNVSTSGASAVPVLDEDWLPENLKGKAKKREEPITPMIDRPLSEFSLLADGDNSADEVELFVWMFFHDLARLRDHVRGVWKQYCRKEIALVTASYITTQTVDIMKVMEKDFCQSHAQVFGGRVDYVEMMKVMFHMKPSLDLRGVLAKLLDMDLSIIDFTMARTFWCLWHFGSLVVVDKITPPTRRVWHPKAGSFPTFHPEAERSSMDDEQLVTEDIAILMPQLWEVGLQCITSGTEEGRKHTGGITIIDERVLTEDMRTFIIDRSRPKPLHLIFQWAMYKDIVLVSRTQLKRALDELHDFARHIISSAKSWMTLCNLNYAHCEMSPVRSMVEDLVERIEASVLEDYLALWKLVNQVAKSLVPYQVWHYNPWACGEVLFSLLDKTHFITVEMANGTRYLGSAVHLYHALRVYERIPPSRTWDRILGFVQRKVFGDHLPVKGECARSFRAFSESPGALRVSRTSRSNFQEHGTGVLPTNYGGSFTGGLPQRRLSQLTNLIVELFRSAGNRVLDPPLRFDALAVLTMLHQQLESDMAETLLALDLFAAEKLSFSILQRWANRNRAQEAFTGYFIYGPGANWKNVLIPGYTLLIVEHPNAMKHGQSHAIEYQEIAELLLMEAVGSWEEEEISDARIFHFM
ncbi:hypothetical protein BT96DRAFT_218130 [Gymnopus androsaceus JB14]|uniref:DUF6604 domain-containing protein n=1 Tax=Gymnopus androsaceus JB14 TaxID=1447944 RepID=A0A6A4H6N0_9AGAR|nr:hypothetical protein BT96DRAFT_218130 [Gymnopus androsaceus JB14]